MGRRGRGGAGDGMLVTVRRGKTNPEGEAGDVRFVKGDVARALHTLRSAASPSPEDQVVAALAADGGAAIPGGVAVRRRRAGDRPLGPGRAGVGADEPGGALTTDVMLAGSRRCCVSPAAAGGRRAGSSADSSAPPSTGRLPAARSAGAGRSRRVPGTSGGGTIAGRPAAANRRFSILRIKEAPNGRPDSGRSSSRRGRPVMADWNREASDDAGIVRPSAPTSTFEQAGSRATAGGWSHSWERPTS